jgi:hypothetical protein
VTSEGGEVYERQESSNLWSKLEEAGVPLQLLQLLVATTSHPSLIVLAHCHRCGSNRFGASSPTTPTRLSKLDASDAAPHAGSDH